MKTFLFDFSNFGLIWVIDNDAGSSRRQWQLNMLRSCILDSQIGRIRSNHSLYQELDNNSILENFYFLSRNDGIGKGEQREFNDIQREKRRLAEIRMPAIMALTEALLRRSLNNITEFALPIDDTLAFEIAHSDPTMQEWSPGVVEYANIVGITPAQAFKEISMDYKTIHSIKIKTYATAKKYQSLIQRLDTVEQSQDLIAEIKQKLISDTYI